MKAELISRIEFGKPWERDVALTYLYRGMEYTICDSEVTANHFTSLAKPTLAERHREEQARIDALLDGPQDECDNEIIAARAEAAQNKLQKALDLFFADFD